VFRAYQPDPGRLVAVKQFTLGLQRDAARRFVAALDRVIAADLTHFGIAAPIAAGLAAESPYLAFDFVAAESFDVVMRDYGPTQVGDALRLTAQLGGALDVAAASGVLHGSLHPRDVLMSADDIRLTGLGIAQALESQVIQPPLRPPYTAPERMNNEAWDRTADVFSLAALAYEMLFGRKVSGPGDIAVVGVTQRTGGDLDALREVFAKALAVEPSHRFDTALAFSDALHAAFGVVPHSVRPGAGRRRRPSTQVRSSRFEPPGLPLDSPADDRPIRPDSPAPRKLRTDVSVDVASLDTTVHTDAADVVSPTDFRDRNLDLDRLDGSFDHRQSSTGDFDVHGAGDSRFIDADEAGQEPALASEEPDLVDFDTHAESTVRPEVDAPEPFVTAEFSRLEPVSRFEPSLRSEPLSRPELVTGPESALRGEPSPPDPRSRREPFSRTEPFAAPEPVETAHATLSLSSAAQEPVASRGWPIGLGVLLGLLVGFAFGYGVGVWDRTGDSADSAAVSSSDSQTASPLPSNAPGATAADSNAPGSGAPSRPATAAAPPAVSGQGQAPMQSGRSSTPPRSASSAARPSAPEPTRPASRGQAPRGNAAPAPAPAARPPAAVEGRLLVRSSPAGARVAIDGRNAGVTPLTATNLSAGVHVVRVSREGYVTAERRVRIGTTPAQPIDVTLAAATASRDAASRPAEANQTTGSLMLESRPPGARVFVDGRPLGTTPLLLDGVSVGEHTVRFEMEGFNPWTATTTLAGGERKRLSGSLER
jgi:hypothetical protein